MVERRQGFSDSNLLAIRAPSFWKTAMQMRAASLATAASIILVTSAAANIFQWEYVDPNDPAKGKRQSSTLAPDGRGVIARPRLNGIRLDLTRASLEGADLHDSRLRETILAKADLRGANLTGASFFHSTLTEADLSGAEIRGADFFGTTLRGFTASQLYSTVSYQTGDLTEIGLGSNDLSGWNFAGKILVDASFQGATLTDANLVGADIRGAKFSHLTSSGFTAAQFYSTASYRLDNLAGVDLFGNDLSGWDFAGKILSDASFYNAVLIGADFRGARLNNVNFKYATFTGANLSGAEIRGASFERVTSSGFTAGQLYSTASYQTGDLTGVNLQGNDLSGWNFAGMILANVNFDGTALAGTNFTGAAIRGASFISPGSDFTRDQIYSTASYQSKDLDGVCFAFMNLDGWDFQRQSLRYCIYLKVSLDGVDFSHGDMARAVFAQVPAVRDGNFSFADLRAAIGLDVASSLTTNAILQDGRIEGLELGDGEFIVVRDIDGEAMSHPRGYWNWSAIAPIPILVQQRMTLAPQSTLRLILESDAWDSTISFEPGIRVTLSGMLELLFADGTPLRGQVGRTIDLFDWTGVSPSGAYQVESPYVWDLTNLYTTGEVTLLDVPEPVKPVAWLLGAAMLVGRGMQRGRGHACSARELLGRRCNGF